MLIASASKRGVFVCGILNDRVDECVLARENSINWGVISKILTLFQDLIPIVFVQNIRADV